jgi:quinol monooxygenase YgiN
MPAMSKTSLIAKMTVHPGKRDEALGHLETALAAAQAEEGTLVYSFHVDKADENVIWAVELYSDDAALGAHGQSPAVAELFGNLGPLLAEPPMMAVCDLHAAKGLEA